MAENFQIYGEKEVLTVGEIVAVSRDLPENESDGGELAKCDEETEEINYGNRILVQTKQQHI